MLLLIFFLFFFKVADLISIPGWSKTDRFEFASIVVKNRLPKEMRLSDWHQSATSEILLSALADLVQPLLFLLETN